MLPNAQSFVDLDYATDSMPTGCRVARRQVHWAENDGRLFNDMVRWSLAMLEQAGAEILTVPEGPATNHELGGCRMGTDPRTVGGQRRLPDARRAEPLRGGWQRVSLGVGEESDAYDHGARGSHRRAHRRAAAEGGAVSETRRRDAEDSRRDRRNVRLSVPGGRALRAARARKDAAPAARARIPTSRPFSRRSNTSWSRDWRI